ncbi:MAG: hypothetical protein ACMX3H_05190 [Sodalis sp. (in: enterobacteria)]|uniref:hypothetical protein n=1 Tax=Sodalis sp. (in: enterobacteria) TaxID=1898979 RepID=UPI0039E3476F
MLNSLPSPMGCPDPNVYHRTGEGCNSGGDSHSDSHRDSGNEVKRQKPEARSPELKTSILEIGIQYPVWRGEDRSQAPKESKRPVEDVLNYWWVCCMAR